MTVRMMASSIQGKAALVTGGSRGIGKATAVALAKAGAKVAVNYKTRTADAEAVCAEINRRAAMPSPCRPMFPSPPRSQKWSARSKANSGRWAFW